MLPEVPQSFSGIKICFIVCHSTNTNNWITHYLRKFQYFKTLKYVYFYWPALNEMLSFLSSLGLCSSLARSIHHHNIPPFHYDHIQCCYRLSPAHCTIHQQRRNCPQMIDKTNPQLPFHHSKLVLHPTQENMIYEID